MDGYVVIGTELDTKNFDSQISHMESKMLDIEDKLKQADMGFEVGDTQKLEAEYEKLGNQIIGLREKQEKYKQSLKETSNTSLSNIQGQLSNIGNGIEGITKKVFRWGLAVFGVRSAYLFIRQAMSTLSQYDEQLASNIEYIRYALANTLAPVIQWIINLVVKLLSYVNYIAQAWFGVNLFANSSAKAFKSAKDNLGKSAKSAKELKNQLAGFDEMNVLQDNKSADAGAGADTGVKMPSFDLSALQGEVPDWLQWIVDHKDEILAVMAGVAAGLLAWKLGLQGIQALGFGVMIAGIVYAIEGLLNYLKDPSWKNFGQIIQGIGIAILGLGIIIGSVPAIVIGAVVLIVGTIIKYWDEIKAFLQKGIDWLEEKGKWIRKFFGDQIGDIYDVFVSGLKLIIIGFDDTFKGLKKILDGIITFVKGVFTGNWKQAWEGVKQIFSGIFQTLLGLAKSVLGSILSIAGSIAMAVGHTIADVFKSVVNAVLFAIENILNNPIRTVNKLIGVINKVPGINLGILPTFKLPRLAKGGIVNMPGRGVPVGGAIAGEAGREAVLPLQDSQVLSEIADAIGRRITINANITNTMNGRVISRELQRVQNDSDFAYNR